MTEQVRFVPDGGKPRRRKPAPKPATVLGRDIQPGQVVKVHGRWLRIVSWADDGFPMRFAIVAPHQIDPRLTTSVTGRWRLIHAEDDYPTRDEPAPVWEHVTRQIERERAEGLRD
jgi:hypothetical protein